MMQTANLPVTVSNRRSRSNVPGKSLGKLWLFRRSAWRNYWVYLLRREAQI